MSFITDVVLVAGATSFILSTFGERACTSSHFERMTHEVEAIDALIAIELVVEYQPALRGNRFQLGQVAADLFPDLGEQVWNVLRDTDDQVSHLPVDPVRMRYWTTG